VSDMTVLEMAASEMSVQPENRESRGRLILVLGGARSGKSRFAQRLAAAAGPVVFVATAAAGDEEMAARIAAHRRDRPAHWTTVEEEQRVDVVIRGVDCPGGTIIVDCLTLLVSNLLLTADGAVAEVEEKIERLTAAARDSRATVIVVSNEVGMGVVPATPLGRLYRDVLGRANQTMAAAADEVYLLVAGTPWRLRGGPNQRPGMAATTHFKGDKQ